jgi:hypothetical protein
VSSNTLTRRKRQLTGTRDIESRCCPCKRLITCFATAESLHMVAAYLVVNDQGWDRCPGTSEKCPGALSATAAANTMKNNS